MPEDVSTASTPILDDFLYHYETADAPVLSAQERALLRSALEYFMLDEWWLRRDSAFDSVESSLAALRLSAEGLRALKPQIDDVEQTCRALAARLERYEHALMIQREHCMMLSMQAGSRRKAP